MQPRIPSGESARTESRQSAGSNRCVLHPSIWKQKQATAKSVCSEND